MSFESDRHHAVKLEDAHTLEVDLLQILENISFYRFGNRNTCCEMIMYNFDFELHLFTEPETIRLQQGELNVPVTHSLLHEKIRSLYKAPLISYEQFPLDCCPDIATSDPAELPTYILVTSSDLIRVRGQESTRLHRKLSLGDQMYNMMFMSWVDRKRNLILYPGFDQNFLSFSTIQCLHLDTGIPCTANIELPSHPLQYAPDCQWLNEDTNTFSYFLGTNQCDVKIDSFDPLHGIHGECLSIAERSHFVRNCRHDSNTSVKGIISSSHPSIYVQWIDEDISNKTDFTGLMLDSQKSIFQGKAAIGWKSQDSFAQHDLVISKDAQFYHVANYSISHDDDVREACRIPSEQQWVYTNLYVHSTFVSFVEFEADSGSCNLNFVTIDYVRGKVMSRAPIHLKTGEYLRTAFLDGKNEF